MIYFRIRLTDVPGQSKVWVPDHEGIDKQFGHVNDGQPVETIRASLFRDVNEAYPDVYTLTWDSLPDAKADKVKAINARTAELIAAGFVHQGVRYPMSLQNQIHYQWMPALSLGASIVMSNIDDTIQTSFDTLTLPNFLATARAFLNATMQQANTLKKKVIDATTVAQVDAVKDTR